MCSKTYKSYNREGCLLVTTQTTSTIVIVYEDDLHILLHLFLELLIYIMTF